MLAYDYGRECPQGPHTPQRLGLSWRRKAPGVRDDDLLADVFCQPSTLDSGRKFGKNSFFGTDDPGMLLKTKDRCGKLGREAGMFMKKRYLAL